MPEIGQHQKASHRILFLDDNIRTIGGHYLELASLLCEGATQLGYEASLVTHRSMGSCINDGSKDSRLDELALQPVFDVRRMERWSLGVDGRSWVERDFDGYPLAGGFAERVRQRLADRFCRRDYRPHRMIDSWANAFVESVQQFRPSEQDRVVVNTGGDFQLLALVKALDRLDQSGTIGALKVHVIFHFAVFDGQVDDRAKAFGRQVKLALAKASRHRVMIHATTKALNRQLAAVGIDSTPMPYPTRGRELSRSRRKKGEPIRVVLAGMPRAEKGRGLIKSVLSSVHQSHLHSGKMVWSMQVPATRWQRYVPDEMLEWCQGDENPVGRPAFETVHGNLASEDYHGWLDTADVGLFLYDPRRYVARCSGVLLEMMVRGTPVIVPDGCWLADKVRSVGGSEAVGWVYRNPEELPGLLDEVCRSLDRVQENCQRHAAEVSRLHSGANSLMRMGVMSCDATQLRAVG